MLKNFHRWGHSLKNNSLALDIGVVLLFTLSFFILTYPLILHFKSGIVGWYNSDAPLFLWNVWEWKHKLLAGDWSFFTTDVFYPHGASFLMHTHTMVQSIFVLALDTLVSNVVTSFNFVFLFSSVAAGYFAYKFFKLLTNNFWASVIGGHYFAFQQLWATYILFGTQNIVTFWYISAALYFYELGWRRHRLWPHLIAGAVVALAFLNDFIIFSFTIFVVALYALARQLFLRREKIKLLIGHAIGAGLAFMIVAGWKIFIMLRDGAAVAATAIPTTADVDFYHADIINLFRPSRFSLLWGNLGDLYKNTSLASGNAFIGFTVIFILLGALFIRPRLHKKMTNKKTALVFFVLYVVTVSMALGPYLHVWGYDTHIPMPHLLLSKLFVQFNNLRMPARWLIPAVFFLSGIVVFLVEYILEHTPQRWGRVIVVCIYAGLILDALFIPKNILFVNNTVSPVYVAIARDQTQYAVLELPLAITSGYFTLGTGARSNMLHQVIHGHPIVGGHLSRLPFSVRDFYEQEPVIKYLLTYKTSSPALDDISDDAIKKFMATYQVGYIIFDKQLAPVGGIREQQLLNYVTSTLHFKPWYEDAEVKAFVPNL